MDRLRVQQELLRLSAGASRTAMLWQMVLALLIAAYFGYPDRVVQAILWAALVLAGQGLRMFRPLGVPELDEAAIQRTLFWHRVRVLYSAAAWGSAGVLLFHATDVFLQLALTVAIVSSAIAFSFSASSHGPTLRLAQPLLIGPVVVSLLMSPERLVWMLGIIGAGFVFLMLNLVQQRARQLEETLLLRMEAQRVREEKQRFFAAASHDLRQPLQAMSLYHSVMSRGDTSAQVVERMGQCIDALDRLLQGILDISRLDAGQVTADPRPTHLPTLMLRVTRLHDATARAKGLRIRLHTPDTWVLTDPALLERIFSNLLSNAIRYTERGAILFAARKRRDHVRLQIIDTGIGIEDAHIDTVFLEFAQLHNLARDPDRGTGLGLATVQRLAQLLNHPLNVQSRPGHGSCFELQLQPAEAPAIPAPLATARGASADIDIPLLKPWRILVVEDNALVRDALVTLLQGWRLEIVAASDVPSAMHCLQGGGIDAVISDWRLPDGQDGVSLLRQARQMAGVKLVALLTGEHVEQAPPDLPLLRKPVRPLRLRALLDQHLGDHPDLQM